jgi:hypothetical protein
MKDFETDLDRQWLEAQARASRVLNNWLSISAKRVIIIGTLDGKTTIALATTTSDARLFHGENLIDACAQAAQALLSESYCE